MQHACAGGGVREGGGAAARTARRSPEDCAAGAGVRREEGRRGRHPRVPAAQRCRRRVHSRRPLAGGPLPVAGTLPLRYCIPLVLQCNATSLAFTSRVLTTACDVDGLGVSKN